MPLLSKLGSVSWDPFVKSLVKYAGVELELSAASLWNVWTVGAVIILASRRADIATRTVPAAVVAAALEDALAKSAHKF